VGTELCSTRVTLGPFAVGFGAVDRLMFLYM
jgi:hypothetical protein